MESATDKEIKYHIRRHIALPYKIKRLETERRNSQLYAYSMQSFTGTSQYGFSIDDYTQAMDIERFVIRLVLDQESLDRQISALKLRYKLFQELLPTLDYPTLKTLLKQDYLSDYEVMVYSEIQEINYYIDQHKKAEKQQQSDNEVASLDLTETDINDILTSDDWETTKQTKISVLNNAEDELMAMLK
ncbi:Uncharacterised protein [Aerococcus viridans]|uniref:Uncharacterized protein n=2 Tax=Aerococcus viridans TaxID=1377 RepID=A0AAU8U4X6_9LACT|nr:hypothetical protein [Aerococcus viridans]AMC00348.1 hypothetical protein AWM76_01530 [Aerococcus viridans]EFG49859.1 hypothetical protein HMPREF0061_0785 [Aerococcus viridans ATCC 11563 = CCUG 4311]SUU09232.1 Uncharacterised protein [Aerococcus viridans]